jgi:hypothetical protein
MPVTSGALVRALSLAAIYCRDSISYVHSQVADCSRFRRASCAQDPYDQPCSDWMPPAGGGRTRPRGAALGSGSAITFRCPKISRSQFVYPTATLTAMKDSGLRIRVERELRERFLALCRKQDRPAAQVLREFMREYVLEHEAGAPPELSGLGRSGPTSNRRSRNGRRA